MNIMIFALATLSSALAFWLLFAARDIAALRRARDDAEARASKANERLHAVSNSALRGHPLVRWTHPNPSPASDRWYWLARFDGRQALFTAEALDTATKRATLLLPAVRVVQTTEPVVKDDKPRTDGTI